ncbi:MAG: glycosyltransferase family 2 protein [Candidatus Binataceae bacterium]
MIIPVFNGELKIVRAVESALAQRYPGQVEVVVADDGSTDGTAAVLDRYAGRITVLHAPHRGVAAARNAAVNASHGELIAFLDADDEWLPGKLELTAAFLGKDPQCVLAYHDGIRTDAQGRIISRSRYPIGHDSAPSLENLISYSWPGLPILFDSVVVRREVFDRVGGFNEELVASEDTWFLIQTRELGHFHYLAEPLISVAAGVSPRREQWYIAGAIALRAIMERRYGKRLESIHLESVLLWAAQEALLRGDRTLARTRYLAAIAQRPFRIKTWPWVAATFVPLRIVRAVAARFPGRCKWLVADDGASEPPLRGESGASDSRADSISSGQEPAR